MARHSFSTFSSRVLETLPLPVLTTVVGAIVVARLREPLGVQALPTTAATTATRSVADAGLDAPLRTPQLIRQSDANLASSATSRLRVGGTRMVHGGPRHQHRSLAVGPRTLKVGWRVNVEGAVAAQVVSSPDERTLYASTLGGKLVALARDDGSVRWSCDLGERVYGAPLVHDDGTLYVGSDAQKFFAISPAGKVMWRLEVEGEADSGAVFGRDGTIVFVAGSTVHAVRRGGDLAWRFESHGKIFTAPAVTEDGLVVFGSQDDHVYAIGSAGALAWSVDLRADVDGAPAIGDDGDIFVGTDLGDVVRLDPRGKLIWRTHVGGYVRGTLSISDNGDVLAGTYGPVPRVVRVDASGAIRGAFAIAGTGAKEFGIHGGPLEDAEGALYFGTQDNAAYVIGADGAVRWRYETGGDVDAPLTMLSDGTLLVASEDGTITMLLP